MAKKRKKESPDALRKRFEAGSIDRWSAGGYGYSVKLFSKAGKLKVSFQHRVTKRTKTQTLFAVDSRELRKQATAIAVTMAEQLREGRVAEEEREPRGRRLEDLTVFDVCLLYMRDRVPGFTAAEFELMEKALGEWYDRLPPAVLEMSTTPARSTVTRDVRGFQFLWSATYEDEYGEVRQPFARDRRVVEIEPADATNLMSALIQKGRSPRTVTNEHDRLSAAFRHVMRQYRTSIGLTFNPIDGRKADRSKAEIPMWEPEEIQKLRATAQKWTQEGRPWQIFVALGLLSSGRRRQSILALTAADHDFDAGTVTWRATAAKAQNYGRGDSVRPMTSMHRSAVLWAIENRPNPLGPEHPLLWMESDPTRSINEEHLYWQFREVEKAAGVEHKPMRAIHSMRRTVVTLVADALGDGRAAEFVDMTVETVRAFSYKQTQAHVLEETARTIDKLLPREQESPEEELPEPPISG